MSITHDLKELEQQGIIDSATADRITEYYSSKRRSFNATTIISIIAALFVGMGIISIISYNWDSIPVGIRSILSLIPLAASSFGCYYVMKNKPDNRSWTEGIAILQALAFTASYALICQTFQLQSDSEIFTYICIIAALPFMFLFKAAGLATVVIISTSFVVPVDVNLLPLAIILCADIVFLFLYYIKWKESFLCRLRVAILPFTITTIVFSLLKVYFNGANAMAVEFVFASLFYSLYLLINRSSIPSRGIFLKFVSYFSFFSLALWCSSWELDDKATTFADYIPLIVISLCFIGLLVYKFRRYSELRWQELIGIVFAILTITVNPVVISIITLCAIGYAIYESAIKHDLIELNISIISLFLWSVFVLKTYEMPFYINGLILILMGIVLIIMNRMISLKSRTK